MVSSPPRTVTAPTAQHTICSRAGRHAGSCGDYGSAPTGSRSPDLAASHGSAFLLRGSEKAPFSSDAGH